MSDASTTPRSEAKAVRRQALLDAAAGLFAAQGFAGVSLDDLGSAAGVSGPAIYRHFPGKQAVLGALLVGVSEELLEGGQRVVAGAGHDGAGRDGAGDDGAVRALVAFHVDFALTKPDVIRVQDRDFTNLSAQDQAAVRSLQLRYIDVWAGALARLHADAPPAELRLRAQAVFGLINSTPHSVGAPGRRTSERRARRILESMALAALVAPSP
ncbi:TetR/AcrR family transcriptional regulator [Sinomonas sp. JGH33]|uniref:TetR/AcrR family transcriptional regulator n=1 Tax=Sinomonas terricola TaxID=3110330 RepID=A0ABU5T4M4_9MICC|nr:TetR/AcrR family transcriptional regulator [Sinomonas sp. JGH33]MEA5454614.1 TetR/AcrR family transcriptional regulator [Sinomonas sp. JGH33]